MTTDSIPGSPTPTSALLIVNARVWTGDPRHPWADAVSIQGERVDDVGRSAELRKRFQGGVIVDARGMTALPRTIGGVLARGSLADLVLVDGPSADLPFEAVDDTRVVLQIVRGRVTVDRDSIVPRSMKECEASPGSSAPDPPHRGPG